MQESGEKIMTVYFAHPTVIRYTLDLRIQYFLLTVFVMRILVINETPFRYVTDVYNYKSHRLAGCSFR